MSETPPRKPKVKPVIRGQMRFINLDLEVAVGEDSPVRAVWAFAEAVDLSVFYDSIRSQEGELGRPATDPKLLFALWVMATLDGVGSARELERLCQTDLRYMWLCGEERPNHHTLGDFRNRSGRALDTVLSQTVARLMNEDLVEMNRVAQDGVRVRAWAGAGSFRQKRRLRQLLLMAKEQVKLLNEERDEDPNASTRRARSARERAAKDRLKRVERALDKMPEAEERKKSDNGKKKTQPRTSTTDPDAKVMKMADGGYRPAYNIQNVTDTVTKVIVAVEVTSDGTDMQQMEPMADQVDQRYGGLPDEWLVDGGYLSLEVIDRLSRRNCRVFGPPRKRKSTGPKRYDLPGVRAWRERMETPEGQAIYKERAATAELVIAHQRNRGLRQLLVRGIEHVRAVALLHAIVHNFVRMRSLGFAF
jgi:transposase